MEEVMNTNTKLQTFKVICPNCGLKQLRTQEWLNHNNLLKCECGTQTNSKELRQQIALNIQEMK